MTELDLELKLRMERVLWAAGFYTRVNVRLASTVGLAKARAKSPPELTDVDVLGARFLEDLTPRRVVVDCKSGKNVSPVGRAFWLRGVMDHLGADRGYVILNRFIPEHHREASANLGITLLGAKELGNVEARFPTLSADVRIGRTDSHRELEESAAGVAKELSHLLEFRNTRFWYYTASQAIMVAIAVTRRSLDKMDLAKKPHRALLLDVIGLFSIAMLTLASQIMRLEPADVLSSVRAHFYGGPEGIARREQIIRRVETILQGVSGQQRLPLDENAVLQLDPPYLPSLADALVRLIGRPLDAAEVPRYLKARLMHGVLHERQQLNDAFPEGYAPLADKLAADVAFTFLRSAGLPREAAKELGFG